MAKKLHRPNVSKGILLPLGNGFSLAVGKNPNKTDDIDIGPNNKNGLSINHGEILEQKGNTVRVFSAEPMLNGESPASLLYRGANPNTVFAAQEQFKQNNRIKDDGSHYEDGGPIRKIINFFTKKKSNTSNNEEVQLTKEQYINDYNNGKYTTKLSDEDEKSFKKWYKEKPVTMFNQSINPDDFEHGYDWRGYWLNEWKPDGGKKEWGKIAASTKDKWHWPDKYKQPHHHTFSVDSKYSDSNFIGGVWNGNKFIPSKLNTTLEYLLANDNIKSAIDRRNNKEINFDDFIRFSKTYKANDLSDNELKTVWDSIQNRSLNSAQLAYLIGSESNYKKTSKNSNSTAKGLGQMTKTALLDLYGKDKGTKIYDEYAKNARSVASQMHDIINYFNKNTKDAKTYGEVKTKHLFPNLSSTSIINSKYYNSFTTSQKSKLVEGKSTVQDLINILNQEYDETMFGYNRSFKNGGIYIKPSKRGTFTAAAKKHGMSVQGFANKVLANKENYSTAMVKKANFAKNASKWHHLFGGEDTLINPLGERPNANNENMSNKRTKAVVGTQQPLRTLADIQAAKEQLGNYYSTFYNNDGSVKRQMPTFGELTGTTLSKADQTMYRTLWSDDFYNRNVDANGRFVGSENFGNINTEPINLSNNNIRATLDRPKDTIVPPTLQTTNNNINNTENNWFKDNKADLIGAGVNALGSIGGAIINAIGIGRQRYIPRRGIALTPSKLKTKININPQLAQMRETLSQIEQGARNNSASSRNVYDRIVRARGRGIQSYNSLLGDKENRETALINQDRLNQQHVRARNVQNFQNIMNTNIAGREALNNRKAEAHAENTVSLLNNLAGIVTGERGLLAREDARRRTAADLSMMSLAYPDAAKLIIEHPEIHDQFYDNYYSMLGSNRFYRRRRNG